MGSPSNRSAYTNEYSAVDNPLQPISLFLDQMNELSVPGDQHTQKFELQPQQVPVANLSQSVCNKTGRISFDLVDYMMT